MVMRMTNQNPLLTVSAFAARIAFISILMSPLGSIASDLRWTKDNERVLKAQFGITSPGLDFTVHTPGSDFVFVPKVEAAPSLDLSYQKIGLGVKLPTESDSDPLRSRVADYQLRMFSARTTPEVIYQNFKGYRPEGWLDSGGQQINRPDVTVEVLNFNLIQNLSPGRYSMPIALSQNGIQRKAGGSFLLLGSFGTTRISAAAPLIPTTHQNNSGSLGLLKGLKTYSLLIGGGYAYILPIDKRYYATAAVFAGYGVQRSRLDLTTTSRWETGPLHRIGVRPGLGYNYGNHIAGIQIIVDANTARILDSHVQQATFTSSVFYAYRFQGVNLPLLSKISSFLP